MVKQTLKHFDPYCSHDENKLSYWCHLHAIELTTIIRKHLFQELKISQRHNPQCQSACKQNSGLAVTGNVSKRGNNLSGKINNDKLFSKSMNRDKKRSLSISTGSVSAACILIDASAVTDESPAVSEVKGSGGAVMGSAL